jgi:hypothetical protein
VSDRKSETQKKAPPPGRGKRGQVSRGRAAVAIALNKARGGNHLPKISMDELFVQIGLKPQATEFNRRAAQYAKVSALHAQAAYRKRKRATAPRGS